MSVSKQDREAKITRIFHGPIPGIEPPTTEKEIIAGDDDRLDYFQVSDNVKKIADATVILTDKSSLTEQADGSFTLDVSPFRQGSLPPCGGERFANQHTGGWCSGFMVGPDVFVTAGHCGETEADIKNTAYVFGFRVASASDPGTTHFSADQVYFGKELIAHDLSSTGDFAIVRVDRKITAAGAVPVTVRKSGAIKKGDNVGVIGYPSGLPVKIAFGANTEVKRINDPWLICNLDTYGGNSGSAVFNEDGTVVEGILVRGARDYNVGSEGGSSCFESNRVANDEGSEAVTKADVFVDKIP
jgi:V8-like Glu-specific endopeptidase